MAGIFRLERFSGSAIEPYVPELARLRIEVFREYPYLYDGSLAYEREYLKTYTASSESVIVVVFDADVVVGASSGLPLDDETSEIRRPFREAGLDSSGIFYFGESVLRRSCRGNGLGVRFFEEREAHALSLGRFHTTCFCAVVRPPDHPARPAGYVPLDRFWTNRGYVRRPELRAAVSWKELGEDGESPKPMEFWARRLRP